MVGNKLSLKVKSRLIPKSIRRKRAAEEIRALRKNGLFKIQRAHDLVRRRVHLEEIDVYRGALHSARYGVKRIAGKEFNYAFMDEMLKSRKPFYEAELKRMNDESKKNMGTIKTRLKIAKKWRTRKYFPAYLND